MGCGDYSVLLFITHLDVSSSNRTCSCDLTVGGTPQRMTHQTGRQQRVADIYLAFVDEAESYPG